MYLIEILHQTTTPPLLYLALPGCILSKFYIKPQQADTLLAYWDVVSYRNSTSNHNNGKQTAKTIRVVSYRNSTSNHNCPRRDQPTRRVVSYRNSTSNHNQRADGMPKRGVVSYRNSTSNHNRYSDWLETFLLYLIEILHQTTTYIIVDWIEISCILSKFYIKPQLDSQPDNRHRSCILSKFYIKPQLHS